MSGRGMPAQCHCVEAQAGGSQRGEYFLTGVVSFTEEMAFELSLRLCRVCRDVEGLSRQESRSAQTEVRDVLNQPTHLSRALRGQGRPSGARGWGLVTEALGLHRPSGEWIGVWGQCR